ncbi:MAG TPA: alpha-L-rhamnosidase N-terminal domain-containing protein [Clostridia bacterium]|nr:alpha-L-rhamnosidase N-terminal domain-containing protein [Clostridia bacterium]
MKNNLIAHFYSTFAAHIFTHLTFGRVLGLLMFCVVGGASAAQEQPLKAKWIWLQNQNPHLYNQTVIARKQFKLGPIQSATLRITADSFYRLSINGRWVNDGPCRSWPSHYQFDVIDAAPYLREGANEIEVVARYYGVGDFHRIPQQAGLLAQLDLTDASGRVTSIISDKSWQVADAQAWRRDTPKVSIQMEPAEIYDARLAGRLKFSRAAELYGAQQGPWKDLSARDVALMTRQSRPFKSFLGAKIVRADGWNFCLPAVRLANPGVIEANHSASAACGMATVVENASQTTLAFRTEGLRVSVDGKEQAENRFNLAPGKHVIVAFPHGPFGHDKEKALRFVQPAGYKLVNPLQPTQENPFVLIRLPEFVLATNDLVWFSFTPETPALRDLALGFRRETDQLLASGTNLSSFCSTIAKRAEVLPSRDMFVQDVHWQFTDRQLVGDGGEFVQNPTALMHDTAEVTTIQPSAKGDIELQYDLGEQDVGYYDFELIADAGVEIDIFGLEYIAPDGRLQHSYGNRNGMRYITSAGHNRFTSLKRRSGRYLFVTLRNQKSPVRIRHFQLISSTYPVNLVGSFSCSDARLDRIWDISTRTLKLCMEDTFTDCPLYEQTHWVGDARNESLLAYSAFGAHDLARRCIQITAHSLERFPIAGCQTPSCWDTLLPAWSFLWGISTWDYYHETGERAFLNAIYPSVIKNLKGAESLINGQGLFSGPFWNMFDWTGSDQDRRTVLHNSMFIVGAIDAALKETEVLNRPEDAAWLRQLRARLVNGVNALWDSSKSAYPDSVHDDGKPSPSTSQHTSILGLLYDIVPAERREAASRNLLNPPDKMIRLGSPFAALYLYEAYEKLGLEEEIIKDIYKNYLPMLESGATTVWESFPSGTTGGGTWPTRSHCHAWSSAPTRFLNRIVLGVKTTQPGGKVIEISPRLSGLAWARGTTLTHAGAVEVSWKKDGKTLRVDYQIPSETKASFVRNPSHEGLDVVVNGAPFRK